MRIVRGVGRILAGMRVTPPTRLNMCAFTLVGKKGSAEAHQTLLPRF
jgi:hypothetical protein